MALLSLVARLGLDKTGFDQGLKSADKSVNSFASNIKGQLAGAFSAAAIGAFLAGVIQTTSRIKDLSEQFGLTTREIQETDFALNQSGQQFEVLASALTKLAQSRRDAVEGSEDLRESFAKFGLTLEELNDPGLRNYDLLRRIAKAMSEMNMTAAEQVQIIDLLGKGSIKLASTLQDLESFKPPALFTDDDINSIDKATKAFAALKLELQAAVAPAASTFLDSLKDTITNLRAGDFSGALESAMGWGQNGMMTKLVEKLTGQEFDGGVEMVGDKPKAEAFVKAMAQDPGGLFQVDKNAKEQKTTTAKAFESLGIPLPGADSLGRIGAFSGGGQAEVAKQLKTHENILRDIRIALTDRGIKIKEL